MSHANPTALRVGMQGMLDGRQHTVLGRVVLGMELDGETYYWNEFNVADSDGRMLTLVFEETDEGPTWKLFRMFEPAQTMTAREAAAHRADERFTFDGMALRVTLVDETRVYHVEGDAPPGTTIGDVANYFNAEAGDRTIVVSWTGDEVEYYEGHNLPAGRIERAFNLPPPKTTSGFFSAGVSDADTSWMSGSLLKVAVFVIIAVVFIASRSSCSGGRRVLVPPPPKQLASATRLPTGTQGRLVGHDYRLTAHALVEVGRVGQKFDRHEYALTDEAGALALLINGLEGDQHQWHLLTPIDPPADFTPYEAAALREKRSLTIAGRPTQVIRLFQATLLAKDGDNYAAVWPANLQYGLLGQWKDDWLVARWTETGLQLYGGKALPEKDVLAAWTAGGK